jgi:hypothetical protein
MNNILVPLEKKILLLLRFSTLFGEFIKNFYCVGALILQNHVLWNFFQQMKLSKDVFS